MAPHTHASPGSVLCDEVLHDDSCSGVFDHSVLHCGYHTRNFDQNLDSHQCPGVANSKGLDPGRPLNFCIHHE